MALVNDSMLPDLIPKHVGFRKLRSFQVAQQVYDATVIFCNRFIDRRSRTHDQIVYTASFSPLIIRDMPVKLNMLTAVHLSLVEPAADMHPISELL